jgi:SAM-dependent methyltransferase
MVIALSMADAEEWVTDEQLWTESYASMFPAQSFEAARHEVEQIVELTGCRAGSVLDLACGPGRHAVPFARRGFAVTAVDRTRFLLDKARERAAAEGVDVEWIERDMREPSRPAAFDLCICMYTSFGVFEEHAENQRVLDNVHRSLRPGAAFVVDVAGKEILARIWQPTASSQLDDGRVFIQRREVVDDWSRIEMEWLYLRGNEVSYSSASATGSTRRASSGRCSKPPASPTSRSTAT